MRVRKQSPTGDYVFGHSGADYYVNTPEAVGQVVLTRLKLWLGEWFADTSDGMDWQGKVLGKYTERLRDATIKARVLGSPGVKQMLSYISNVDERTRTFTVTMVLDTVYGPVGIGGAIVVAVEYDRLDIDFYLDRSFII